VSEPKPYVIHSAAWREFEESDEWYLARSADSSVAFLSDVYEALEAIAQAPQRWPKYLYGTRRFVLRGFPFSIIYLDDPDVIRVIAVAHSRRRPGYWKDRL
jgi:plasmid stabilization system protein ParE